MPNEEITPEAAMILKGAALFGNAIVALAPFTYPPVAAGMAVLAAPGTGFNVYQRWRNRSLGSSQGLCLVANSLAEQYLDTITGEQGQIARFFTSRGIPIGFHNGAKVEDFKQALHDPKIQHIAVVGHGDGSRWRAKDGYVTIEDVLAYREAEGLPAKRGYFLQVTCGLKDTEALGSAVVENPQNVLGYRSLQNIHSKLRNTFSPNMGLVQMCDNY